MASNQSQRQKQLQKQIALLRGQSNQLYNQAKKKQVELHQLERQYDQITGAAQRRRQQQERIKLQNLKRQKQEKQRKQREDRQAQKKRKQQELKKQQQELKKQQQQKLRLRKQGQFNKIIKQINDQISKIQNLQKDLAIVLHEGLKTIQQKIQFLVGKKKYLDGMDSQLDELRRRIEDGKTAGIELGHKLDIKYEKRLQQLVCLVNENRIKIDDMQQQQIDNDKVMRMNDRKIVRQQQIQAEMRYNYKENVFYELQIRKLYNKQIQHLRQKKYDKQRYNRQLSMIEQRYRILKMRQIYINEIKILIQLQQLSKQQLIDNKFNLQQYKQLLIQKSKLIAQFKKGNYNSNNQLLFNKICKSLLDILSPLKTEEVMLPYRYPSQLLIKTKQNLIEQYYQSSLSKLQKQLNKQKIETLRMETQYQKLVKLISQQKQKFRLASSQYQLFINRHNQKLQAQLRWKNEQQSISRLQPNVIVVNMKQISNVYKQMNNQQRVQKVMNRYQQKQRQISNLKQEYKILSQQYIKQSTKTQQQLIQSNYQNIKVDEQQQFYRLMKRCEQINEKKRSIMIDERLSQQKRYNIVSNIISERSYIYG